MTNIDSIFKSRDITLSTKVHLVKAMVFPVGEGPLPTEVRGAEAGVTHMSWEKATGILFKGI